MDNIAVSVICAAYNHEKYIRDALEGFVSQKTDFRFEVLVNDDASTDGTAAIIREYAEKYPDIIRPVYQPENLYSKGVKIWRDVLLPMARGRYIAFCEGDDYWCDDGKLAMQKSYLDTHPECSAVVHNSRFFSVKTGESYVRYGDCDRDVSVAECISSGSAAFHTSSIMERRELSIDPPAFVYSISGVGDYPRAIYLVMSGTVHYFGRVMSVYRAGTSGSWTERVAQNEERMIKLNRDIVRMLEMADEYSEGRYSAEISAAVNLHEHTLCLLEHRYGDMFCKKYREYNRAIPMKLRMKYRILALFPFLFGLRTRIKNKNKN